MIKFEQILAQSVLTTSSDQDYSHRGPNWRRCWFSNSQKQEYCFDIDSSHSVESISELNSVPDPFKSLSVTEIDQAAEEAMDRSVGNLLYSQDSLIQCPEQQFNFYHCISMSVHRQF